MILDKIIKEAINYKGKYKPDEIIKFTSDALFMDYLHTNYCDVYDFIEKCDIKDNQNIPIAGITIDKNSNIPILYIHAHRITYMLREMTVKIGPGPVYDALACLLWHEALHIILKHFRVPFHGYNHRLLNIAQDILIDNMIHNKCYDWRNWHDIIKEINTGLLQNKSILKPINNSSDSPTKILNQNDLFIYTYLIESEIDIQKFLKYRFDNHEWSKENDDINIKGPDNRDKTQNEDDNDSISENESESKSDKNNSNEKKADNNKSSEDGFDDFFDELAKKAMERNRKNKNRTIADIEGVFFGDNIIEKIAKGKDHNLFNLLKKYIKFLSAKKQNISWKKVSRKQPGKRPGIKKEPKPGHVVLIIDTSASMEYYLKNYFENTLYGIYTAFSSVTRIYGMPSIFNKIEVDDSAPRIEEIGRLEELKRMKIKYGGGTNYKLAFEVLLRKWQKETKSLSRLPDFIIFISDFGCNLDFLNNKKYRELDKRLIWIYTDYPSRISNIPPIGTVIFAYADDWLTSVR